jgi:hypothetical protein
MQLRGTTGWEMIVLIRDYREGRREKERPSSALLDASEAERL